MEEGEEVVTFEMETFSTSGAFGLLEEASKGGDVSEEKLERYKSMFTQMFQELKRTKDSDESLETQLGQLEKQLAEEKLKMESGRGIGEEGESTSEGRGCPGARAGASPAPGDERAPEAEGPAQAECRGAGHREGQGDRAAGEGLAAADRGDRGGARPGARQGGCGQGEPAGD